MASYTHQLIFSLTILSYLLLILLLLPFSSNAADPGPLQDFCVADLNSPPTINGYPCKKLSESTSADFFNQAFKQVPKNHDSLGLNLTRVDVTEFPGLNTLGVSMNRASFLPGGLNPPHVHPRASELSLVTEGQLLVGWVSTANVLYYKVVSYGELFVIPPGLVHFQMNVGKGNARFYASFNSQNPGVLRVFEALFDSAPQTPDVVLGKALNVNETIIQLIKDQISKLNLTSTP